MLDYILEIVLELGEEIWGVDYESVVLEVIIEGVGDGSVEVEAVDEFLMAVGYFLMKGK